MKTICVYRKQDGSWIIENAEINPSDTLGSMYKLIGCELVEVLHETINGKEYDFWFDEEFLLKEEIPPATIIINGSLIRGKVLVTRSDNEGEMFGLTDKEEDGVRNWLQKEIDKMIGKF